jgi:hypothetical protein
MSTKEWADLALEIVRLIFSWPVLIVAILIAFRIQILEFLVGLGERLTNVKISGAEFRFAPKTSDTFFGKTNVSAVATTFSGNSLTFRSQKYRFEISFPSGKQWESQLPDNQNDVPQEMRSLAPPGTAAILFLVKTAVEYNHFRPNVNVIMQPVGDDSIKVYMAKTASQFLAANIEIDSFDLDERTNGAYIAYNMVFRVEGHGEWPMRCVARVALSQGLAFIATATTLKDSVIPADVQSDLSSMLNSFQLVRPPAERARAQASTKESTQGKNT